MKGQSIAVGAIVAIGALLIGSGAYYAGHQTGHSETENSQTTDKNNHESSVTLSSSSSSGAQTATTSSSSSSSSSNSSSSSSATQSGTQTSGVVGTQIYVTLTDGRRVLVTRESDTTGYYTEADGTRHEVTYQLNQ